MATYTTTTVENVPGGLRVIMPVPRVGCVAIFLTVWMCGWLAGELSAIGALVAMGAKGLLNPAAWFIVVWLVGWSAGGLFAGGTLAMMLNGKEIVTFTAEQIERRAEAFGRGFTWRYPMADVTNVRQTSDTNGVKDFISFDHGGKTIRFGTGLNETEAERVTEAVWDRFPQLMPRVERIRREEERAGFSADGAARAPVPDAE